MDFLKFRDPDTILRPAPFWAVNDVITPEETERQMRDMMRVGLSGGFFHSRSGLVTDYLGEEWFASIQAAIDVAKEQGGYLWLYDEDQWPSGNAGGRITAMNEDYKAAVLQPEYVPVGAEALPDGDDKPRAAYLLIGRKGATAERIERIDFDEARTRTDAERLLFRLHAAEQTPWWGGESPANVLHPEVTKEFIRQTHEVYKEKFGDEFGKSVPGIFTDEPNIHVPWANQSVIAWWDGIPEKYVEWNGRDFWDDAPYLYIDGPKSRKIRLLVHRTILRQFCEGYSKPIFEWCESNNIAMTGHYLEESTFIWQINATAGGIMAHYRYQHIPGIDHLARVLPGPMVGKQVGSAARQLGRSQVLVESFGVSRHTNTFEDFKWLADNDMVLGATFFCPHLSLYSAKGRRKRDYPPNWNYQQTYWDELNPLNDYMARMGYILSTGKASPDLLLLHPIESATASRRYGLLPARKAEGIVRSVPDDLPSEDLDGVNGLDAEFKRVLDAVMNAGYDCDLGDENFIEEMGAVEGSTFRIGEMTYPLVVVPPSTTWRPKTFLLLEKFARNGGKLIILGKLPTEIDCDDASEKWESLMSLPGVVAVPAVPRTIQTALDERVQSAFEIRDPEGNQVPGLYVQHRVDGDQEFFFIVNSDRDRSHDLVFTSFGKLGVPMADWNASDGTRTKIAPDVVGRESRYAFTLPPAGSKLIAVGAGVDSGASEAAIPCRKCVETIELPQIWEFARSEENVLVMDRISASPDGGKTWWDEDMDFRVRARLAKHFETTEALTWQPWVAVSKHVFDGKGGEVVLRYAFKSATDRPKSAYLVVEDLKKGRVRVNGTEVDISSACWHWDRSFGKVEITDLVKKGENIVDFKVDYDFLTEVEAAYIVGEFGVRLCDPCHGEIVDEPLKLNTGSWLGQGYPFYSGSITYKTSVEKPTSGDRAFLKLKHPSGILYKVRVNGIDAGKILWRPYELEISKYLNEGANELEITVVSSRQNSMGPLHERGGDDAVAAPEFFENEVLLRPEFSLYDYGLLRGVEIAVSKS
jgi:hypothetical protein